jgi:hypothetical protein
MHCDWDGHRETSMESTVSGGTDLMPLTDFFF